MSRKMRYWTANMPDTRAVRDEIWEHNFRHVWLSEAMSDTEYAEIKDFSLVVLKELYPGIWLDGPHYNLWRERKTLLLNRLDQLAAGGLWNRAGEIEFNRQVYLAFCEQGKVHGGTLNGFAARYQRSMLPTSSSVISVYKVAKHPYWLSKTVQRLERDPRVIGEGRSYWPSISANNLHRSTLGFWMLTEMGERSAHAKRLLELHETFWAWLAATDVPAV